MADRASPSTAWGWHHTSLAVRDLEAAMAFYGAAFGYEPLFVERDMGDQIARMAGVPGLRCDLAQLRSPISGHILELIAFHPSAPAPAAPVDPGRAHVAFQVEDLDRALAHLRTLGAEPIGEITRFDEGRCVYCREPSGTVFELEETQRGGAR